MSDAGLQSCTRCDQVADPRVSEVLLCAGCLRRHHVACWPGACVVCGGQDPLGPLPRPGPTLRVVPPAPRRRVRKGRVLFALALVGAGAAALVEVRREVEPPEIATEHAIHLVVLPRVDELAGPGPVT